MPGTASLQQLAERALAVVTHVGRAGPAGWSAEATAAGIRVSIEVRGAALPASVPGAAAPPEMVRATPGWRGAYHLTVRVPLTVLELEWNAAEPVRIFAFSRGAWEAALAELAGVAGAVRR